MLSKLTKPKKGESKSSQVPAWHLDFRDPSGLPDVKPIRTTFFVNTIAVVIAAGIALVFLQQEFKLFSLRGELAALEAQIDVDRTPSAAAVKKFQSFRAEEKKLKEVLEFVDIRIAPSAFLMRIGEILPEKIIITSIDVRNGVFTLQATVSGTPDEASGLASGLVDLLNEDEVLGPLFDEADITSLLRNPATGLLNMEVRLPLTPKE